MQQKTLNLQPKKKGRGIIMSAVTSQKVKKLFKDADVFKSGLLDQFDSNYNVMEAINANYKLVEFYIDHRMLKLTPEALCYLIRQRNIKEKTNPTPTRLVVEGRITRQAECFEQNAWDMFDKGLKMIREV
jgi:hypothetical protein